MEKEFTGKKAMGAIGSPVALITSSHSGIVNVTTVNMIAGISFSPPLVCISLSHHSFTRGLIDGSGEFAVNMISSELLDIAKKAGSTTGRKIDKFKEFNVEVYKGEKTSCPLIKAAHTILECRVDRVIDLGKQILYIALVVGYHDNGKSEPLYLNHGKYYRMGPML